VRTRLIVLVALAVLLAGVMVTGALTKDDGGVRVQAGGPSLLTTTTQTPVTTASEAVSTAPITAPIPVATTTTVVTAASASPPTTPEATSQVAAQEVPEAAPVPEEVQPETTQTAVRAETKCLADEATCHPPTTEAEWAIARLGTMPAVVAHSQGGRVGPGRHADARLHHEARVGVQPPRLQRPVVRERCSRHGPDPVVRVVAGVSGLRPGRQPGQGAGATTKLRMVPLGAARRSCDRQRLLGSE
jgi:hypothetical protein